MICISDMGQPTNLIILTLFCLSLYGSQAQSTDTLKTYHFDGSVEVTNNGFSFIPTFSLGKPATIANFNMGGDRFTFEPQFRFDLDGMRPWSILGFWRYKIIKRETFMLRVGTQFPALAFTYEAAQSGNVNYDKILAQRFLPFDLTVHKQLTNKVGVGIFYLHGIGLERAEQLNHSNFIALNGAFTNLMLTKKIAFNWNPQLYFLKIDEEKGIYTAQGFSLRHLDFPISIMSMFNIELDSELPTDNLTWNISLVYSFSNQFSKN